MRSAVLRHADAASPALKLDERIENRVPELGRNEGHNVADALG